MRIVSVTITDSREAAIGDALRSVADQVDACLVIDCGVDDRTIEVAREIAGEKFSFAEFEWTGSFADARNFQLYAAHQLGADWAIFVDSDERYDWGEPPFNLRRYLEGIASPAVLVRDRSGHTLKERIFRLPAILRFAGRTHECFPAADCPELPRARNWEVPKTEAESRRKFQRDLLILREEVAKSPLDSRSWFYIGQMLEQQDDPESLRAYERAFETTVWDEEAGWSAYRSAFLLQLGGRDREALAWCARGMTRHAAMAELPWYAAWICNEKLLDPVQAMRWALVAEDINARSELHRGVKPRVGFSYPLAHHDGPHDIVRRAAIALGKKDLEIAEERLRAAAAFRASSAASVSVATPPAKTSVVGPTWDLPAPFPEKAIEESKAGTKMRTLRSLTPGERKVVNRIANSARAVGTDSLRAFDYGYERDGGYALQQHPEEIAAAILHVSRELGNEAKNSLYVEIGCGSGGTARFVAENLEPAAAILVDSMEHPRAVEIETNIFAMRERGCDARLMRGRSDDPLVWRQIAAAAAARSRVVVLIDADHGYDAVRRDVAAAIRHLPRNSVLLMHDVVACEGVRRVWEESRLFVRVAEYASATRPLGIGVGLTTKWDAISEQQDESRTSPLSTMTYAAFGEGAPRILFGVANGDAKQLEEIATRGIHRSMASSCIPYAIVTAGEPGKNSSIFPLYNSILGIVGDDPEHHRRRHALSLRAERTFDLEAVVLLHTDVEIEDEALGYKILGIASCPSVGVAGVIGGRGQSGIRWWEGEKAGRARDLAATPDYGYQDDCRVTSVDGLLLVLTRQLLRRGVLFDESTYSGFHGYDADVCRQSAELGLEVRVVPIELTHHCKREITGGDSSLEAADAAFRRKWRIRT